MASALLDTNVLITEGHLSKAFSDYDELYSSYISRAEIQVGIDLAKRRGNSRLAAAEQERLNVYDELHETMPNGFWIPFDEDCSFAHGELASVAFFAGDKKRARSYDTAIAATAKANDLVLLTANVKDFELFTDYLTVAQSTP